MTLIALVIVVSAQVAAGVALVISERSAARARLVTNLETYARIVSFDIAAALSFTDVDAAIETLRSLGAPQGFEHACLYDPAGRLFASHVTTGRCPAAPSPDGAAFDDEGLLGTTAVVTPRGQRIGTLAIRNNLNPVTARMQRQMFTTGLVLLLSAAAAGGLMALLLRQLTEPLQQLASTVEAVTADRDYAHRVTKYEDDEVGAVADAVNDMLSQIQTRDNELQNALRLKDEFLATVSHELRTPLNAMLGWSHVLRSPELSVQITQQAVDAIDRNARLQARLIEDILDVSRIITGKLRLELRPADLVAITRSAVDVVLPSAKAKRIAIETVLPGSAPFVGDPDRLRQVIWNLLSNAVKFTPQGGTIKISIADLHHEYCVAVTDNGRGISPDFLPYVFQPFRQADGSPTRSQGGLGLGLAIARHLTELSGGSIHADSPGDGAGATFSIRLPRHESAPQLAVPEEPSPMPQRWSDLAGHEVVVVDDNEDTRQVLATMLEAHGATVRTAASVEEARQALAVSLPDVLITDLAMPIEDGFGLLEYCRHHGDPRLQTLPIIALTAYGGEQAEQRVLAAGFDAYLSKPVEPAEVGQVVRDLARAGRTGPQAENR